MDIDSPLCKICPLECLVDRKQFPEIKRSLNKEEFEIVREMVDELSFKYGWIKEFEGAVKCLTPDFASQNPFG